jgi:large subunit ribosomal protein L19
VERNLYAYSPLIRNVKVLQRAFIHKGKKRVRRSKLYYLRNVNPEFYTIK